MPDAIWVVIFSTVIPAAIVFAGRFLDKRRGIPDSVDGSVDSHVQFVFATLKDEIQQRKADAENCATALTEANARIADLEKRGDLLQAQVNRLLAQVNGVH